MFFPSYSGRLNLRLLGRLDGIGDQAVRRCVGARPAGRSRDDEVKRYSLGMRQRFGLAAVLLKDPALLILDEPANGLDPAGIREIRLLLRELGGEGRTVFVSSHQLGEIRQTCDRVAILRAGRCVETGVHEVLTNGRAPRDCWCEPTISPPQSPRWAPQGFAPSAQETGSCSSISPQRRPATSPRRWRSDRLWVTELRPQELSLEDVFLELTEAAS